MQVVIVGNGIAGITAARHIRKQSDCQLTVIAAETDYFFARTALMYVYMGHQTLEHTKPYEDSFWAKNRINLVRGTVTAIDFEQQTLRLSTNVHTVGEHQTLESLAYDKLILATGSLPKTLIPKHIEGVQGLYSVQDLALLEKNTKNIKRAVVVGGGLIGVELAEMLHSRQIDVTMLVREAGYWGNVLPAQESALVSQHIRKRGIALLCSTEVSELLTNAQNQVSGVITSHNQRIEADFVGISIGVSPNVDFLRNTTLEVRRGILVNEFLETNQPHVYAIGDCTELRNPPPLRAATEPIWYTGRLMGETVAQNIIGHRIAYNPGVFFNSAKFFDLEYQTYGHITTIPNDGIGTLYWQHPVREVCLRINYQTKTNAVVGIQALGWRLRQVVCERWIKEQATLSYVQAHLQEASFDPEFSEKYQVTFGA